MKKLLIILTLFALVAVISYAAAPSRFGFIRAEGVLVDGCNSADTGDCG